MELATATTGTAEQVCYYATDLPWLVTPTPTLFTRTCTSPPAPLLPSSLPPLRTLSLRHALTPVTGYTTWKKPEVSTGIHRQVAHEEQQWLSEQSAGEPPNHTEVSDRVLAASNMLLVPLLVDHCIHGCRV